MPLTLTEVQKRETRLDPETGETQSRIVKINPYLLISVGGQPNIFLQGGHAWYESDPEPLQPPYPAWLLGEISKCSAKALREVGWGSMAPLPHRSELLAQLHTMTEDELEALLAAREQRDRAPVVSSPSAPAQEDDLPPLLTPEEASEAAEMAEAEGEPAASSSGGSFVDSLLKSPREGRKK